MHYYKLWQYAQEGTSPTLNISVQYNTSSPLLQPASSLQSYGMDYQGIIVSFPAGAKNFSPLKASRPAL